jgi:hypothetical protein
LPGVDAHDVAASLGHQLEKPCRLRPEVDRRHGSNLGEYPRDVRPHVLGVIAG